MSDRGYYTDSYTTSFSARIIESYRDEVGNVVILDQTYFYPTSGGQPFDTGMIDGTAVSDVLVREGDGAVMHVVEQLPQAERVTAVVDWERRFDHMQQHTGQHLLSQAFIQTAGAQTVGFHLSDETATVDLDQHKISQDEIKKAETLANQIVWQNRPVVVRWATREEAAVLRLRKIPPNGGDKLRLIDIVDFDLTACGGTHVARTGEVGLVKVIKTETRNKKARIHFACGGRALAHYGFINQVVLQLSNQLTTGAADLAASVEKIRESEKDSRRSLKRLQNQLSDVEAQQLLSRGRQAGDVTVVTHVLINEPGRARALASRIVEQGKAVALVASTGEQTQLVFGRSDDAPGNMKELLQFTFDLLGDGNGGGSEKFAQGTALPTDQEHVLRAVEGAAGQFLEEMSAIG